MNNVQYNWVRSTFKTRDKASSTTISSTCTNVEHGFDQEMPEEVVYGGWPVAVIEEATPLWALHPPQLQTNSCGPPPPGPSWID